jgi:hypothetical protein
MRPQALWWPVLVCLLFLLTTPPAAAEAAALAPAYRCRPVAQPPGGCDAACQQEVGSALLQLHAGLQGVDGDRPPWHNESVLGLCRPHCHAVPPYCGWPGVQCCHNNDDRSRVADHSSGCRRTPVEQEMCPNVTLPGAVWKLDLTMQKLGGSLTDGVVDALKTLTGWGLHAVDFSRCVGSTAAASQGAAVREQHVRLWSSIPSRVRTSGQQQQLRRFCGVGAPGAAVCLSATQAAVHIQHKQQCVCVSVLHVCSNNLSGTIPDRLSELGPNFTTINLNFNSE